MSSSTRLIYIDIQNMTRIYTLLTTPSDHWTNPINFLHSINCVNNKLT